MDGDYLPVLDGHALDDDEMSAFSSVQGKLIGNGGDEWRAVRDGCGQLSGAIERCGTGGHAMLAQKPRKPGVNPSARRVCFLPQALMEKCGQRRWLAGEVADQHSGACDSASAVAPVLGRIGGLEVLFPPPVRVKVLS